jgi:hypothetical protein
VPGMIRLYPRAVVADAGESKLPQCKVAAMTVVHIGHPPTQNSFCAIGFTDVVLAVGAVGDEVDSLNFCERDAPIGIAVVGDHLAQLVVGQQHAVEARERNLVPGRDLQDRQVRRASGAPIPRPRIAPLHDESIDQRCEEATGPQVPVPVRGGALVNDLSEVLESPVQARAPLSIGDEDDPVPGRVGGESPRRDVLGPCVFPDAFFGQVLRALEATVIAGLEAVPAVFSLAAAYLRQPVRRCRNPAARDIAIRWSRPSWDNSEYLHASVPA